MEKTYKSISRLLAGHMMGYALSLMKGWTDELGKKQNIDRYSSRLESLQSNYNFIIEHFMQSDDDGQLVRISNALIRDAFILLDDIYADARRLGTYSRENTLIREQETTPVPARVESEDDLNGPPQVFRFFWLTRHIQEADLNVLDEYILNPQMEEEALMGISGLTINLLRTFNEDNLLFLITICGGRHPLPVMERAWVGLLLVLIHYDNRLPFFPNVTNMFQDIIATPDGNAFALGALSALVRTSSIHWVTDSFSDMQGRMSKFLADNVQQKFGNNALISLTTTDMDDFSREVADEFRSLMSERENEIIKLQRQHLDVNYVINKHLYRNDFFQEPFHWLLPYDTDYLLTDKELQIAAQFEPLFSPELCDSDRFALIEGIASLPTPLTGIPEGLDRPQDDDSEPLVCNAYVMQLYRFFTLNPFGVADAFNITDTLAYTLVFKFLRPTARDKVYIADQFFMCHSYHDALAIYTNNAALVGDADTWRHYGLCLQKNDLFEEAISAYDMSLELETSEWALRQKVWCLMHSGLERYDDAMHVLDQLLLIRPDNIAYLFQKGKCLEHMELTVEALNTYCKIDMLSPGDIRVMRAIAWCSFLCDDNEQAELYYRKLTEHEQRNRNDYLNYGHLLFVQRNRAEAYRYYRHALHMSDSIQDFLMLFRPDRKILLEKGIPTTDIYMMEDRLVVSRSGDEL